MNTLVTHALISQFARLSVCLSGCVSSSVRLLTSAMKNEL